MKDGKRFVTRSNLRDIIILCAVVSSPFYSFNTATTVIGLFLLFTACFLHIVAKGILIRNSVLCNKGIYGIVRHPYYLANYLIDCSFCVLSGSPYLLLAYPFAFFWSYGPTLRNEETFLASTYGASFINDNLNIPQIFPDISCLKVWRRMFEGFSVKRITFKECARIMRFYSVGFAIILIHAVQIEPLTRLNPLFHPTVNDYDEFLFMILAAAFLSISFVFLQADHNNRTSGDVCSQSPVKAGSK
jgi:hypothetical protein